MTDVPAETKRAICLEMADWLEGRRFGVTMLPGQTQHDAMLATMAWTEGYRRAIHELRWAAREPETVPDDAREIDGL